VVEMGVQRPVGERAVVSMLAALVVLAIGVATWQLLERDPDAAGWATLVAGVALVAAGLLLRSSDRRARVVLSFVDRAFDGCVLGALAWVTRGSDPAIAAAALVALAAGFLASYIRAKGGSLGYGVEEGVVTPVIRYGLLSAALLLSWTAWAIWAIAIVNLLAAAVRASQVAKEERL
jgi:hypothetical protein